jgi:molybdate/tungstate transport system substrate-binding protein
MAGGLSGRRSVLGTFARVCALLITASVVGRAQAVGTSTVAAGSDEPAGPLIIATTISMAHALRQLAANFVARHPAVVPEVRIGGSVAVARAIASSAEVPDIFVSADDTVIDAILIPRAATWSAGFARTSLVLAYTGKSKYADEINTRNWTDVLTMPDVHGARADPAEDATGYRAIMFFELAARFYLRPHLTSTLEHAMPVTDFGADERDLEAKFADGTIDYMPIYRASAADHELEWLELPGSINLGDTAFAASYAAVHARIPSGRSAADTATIFGAPILYGLTIPRAAPHAETAAAFVRYVLSPAGGDVLHNSGFDVPARPLLHGDPPSGLTTAGEP